MDLMSNIVVAEVVDTVFYTALGAALMLACWKVIDWITPFPIIKEIEEDQNMALAVLMGAVFIALAIIIAAVIRS